MILQVLSHPSPFHGQKPAELDDAAELEPYTSAAARWIVGWGGWGWGWGWELGKEWVGLTLANRGVEPTKNGW